MHDRVVHVITYNLDVLELQVPAAEHARLPLRGLRRRGRRVRQLVRQRRLVVGRGRAVADGVLLARRVLPEVRNEIARRRRELLGRRQNLVAVDVLNTLQLDAVAARRRGEAPQTGQEGEAQQRAHGSFVVAPRRRQRGCNHVQLWWSKSRGALALANVSRAS